MLKPIRTGVQFMFNLIWNLLAKPLARPAITRWLIKRALCTPYEHITSADGSQIYMSRWWLFNPYNNQTRESRYRWLPLSLRIHHIRVPDQDQHLHDHPWNARTLILKGWYTEQRLLCPQTAGWCRTELVLRKSGTSARLNHGEFHRIDEVSPGGVFTLFITFRYAGSWGFLVDGFKVPWREYLSARDSREVEKDKVKP